MRDKIVFFDLETGGTDPARHPIIQFAAVAVHPDDGMEVDSLEVKLHFRVDACEPEALKLNSFEPKVWQESAVPPLSACRSIHRFLSDHATVPVPKKSGDGHWMAAQMAGHNAAGFDFPFLRRLFEQSGQFLPGRFLVLDTLQLAMWWQQVARPANTPENFKLETLCAYFGIPLEAHDALADVRATAELAKRLQARLSVAA